MKINTNILLLLSFIYFSAHFVFALEAKSVLDPELDFITQSFIFKTTSHKKFIIRKNIDIYESGKPGIFLRTIVGGGKLGQYWTAYIPNSKGSYDRFDDLQFREDTFKAGKVPEYNPAGGIITYYPGKGGGELVRLLFKDNKVHVEKIKTIDIHKNDDRAIFKKIFGRKMGESLPPSNLDHPHHSAIKVEDVLKRAGSDPEKTIGETSQDQGRPLRMEYPVKGSKPTSSDKDRKPTKESQTPPENTEASQVAPLEPPLGQKTPSTSEDADGRRGGDRWFPLLPVAILTVVLIGVFILIFKMSPK